MVVISFSEMSANNQIVKLPHHEQLELCVTRPAYRQGHKLTAVKVYTVNNESQHLIISGVPKLQLAEEIKKLASPYGQVKKVLLIAEYPAEEFTETYHIQYGRIQSARIAKRFIDGKNFYGGLLHVFYAPELESLVETRAKLIQRRKDIATRIKRHQEDPTDLRTAEFIPKDQYHRKKRNPALPLSDERLAQVYPSESQITIYDGIPRLIDPRPISEPSLPQNWPLPQPSAPTPAPDLLRAPYQSTDAVMRAAGVRSSTITSQTSKNRNYKGRHVKDGTHVKIVRPRIIDTRNVASQIMASQRTADDKKVFSIVKKVESGITIKLLPNHDETKKRIILKDPSTSRLIEPSPNLQTAIELAKTQIRAAMQNNV